MNPKAVLNEYILTPTGRPFHSIAQVSILPCMFKSQLIVVGNRGNNIRAGCRYFLMNALSLSHRYILLESDIQTHKPGI